MASQRLLSHSISFSGAGFLGCYHLGVANCLIKYGILNKNTLLLGSSAGSIVASGISAGVSPGDGMNIIIECVKRVRHSGGLLDTLRPGLSLVDEIESLLLDAMLKACNYDNEYFMHRIQHGKLLHIYLTNPLKSFPHTKSSSFCVNYYRDFKDVVAASMLSSFIPGVTGPLLGVFDPKNTTIRNSYRKIQTLLNRESLKTELYWDGGISAMFPKKNESTIIISPLSGDFSPNLFISPKLTTDSKLIQYQGFRVGITQENITSLHRMIISSDLKELENRFHSGYDDAKRFLNTQNMI